MKTFSSIWFEHVPRAHKYGDLLATLAPNNYVPDKAIDVWIIKRTSPTMVMDLFFPKSLVDLHTVVS